MRRAKLYGLCLLSVTLLAPAAPSWGAEKTMLVWHSDADSAWEATKTSKRPMLLFFTMQGCSYCEQMKRVTYSDDLVISDIQESFVAAAVDSARYPTLVRKLGIRTYPTTVIIGTDGRVIEKINGYVEPRKMRRRLRSVSVKSQQ